MKDLVQTASEIADARGGHQDFGAMAREIAGKLVYPVPREWVEANPAHVHDLIGMHDRAAEANRATIASALAEAGAGEREENSRLREALHPFVEWLEEIETAYPNLDDEMVAPSMASMPTSMGELRRARYALLASAPPFFLRPYPRPSEERSDTEPPRDQQEHDIKIKDNQ